MNQCSTPSILKILYVEDEIIVALDVEDGLRNELKMDVCMVHTLSAARHAIARETFDYALLDLNLGNGERSIELGLELARKGTTVVFASGYNRNEISEIADFPLVEKPFRLSDIARQFQDSARPIGR